MTKLLLVEDDSKLRRSLAINLTARGFQTLEAATGQDALNRLSKTQTDLVVLDLGLPDMDGIRVLLNIREESRVPVIVLSARNKQSEKVTALEAGADDFISKPFGLEELVARIRSVLRRARPPEQQEVVDPGGFTLDFVAKTATKAGQPIRLTPTEWRLARALTRKPGQAVAAQQLLKEVWGSPLEGQEHYLRVYMLHLRKKLEPEPARPRHFITVPGFGYRYQP